MRYVNCIVAAAALAGALAGCADSYYPRYGYSQGYYQPSGYSYPASYSQYPSSYYRSTAYDTRSDYYRNYRGIHPGPEQTFP
jgi:hypothetical protein